MNDKHFVITIERQYGSGGRLTGKRLAEELGIHFYDEEILKMTSETSAIGEQYFRLADERAGNNLLYRIVTSMKPELTEPDKDGPNITSPENLFRFQSSVIRRLAASETCIIVGRCGNYVLQDQMDNLVRIFVYADTVTRIRRVMDVDKVDEAEALRIQDGTHSWLVVVNHRETGADGEYIGAEGHYGLGRMMACDETDEGSRMTVLQW